MLTTRNRYCGRTRKGLREATLAGAERQTALVGLQVMVAADDMVICRSVAGQLKLERPCAKGEVPAYVIFSPDSSCLYHRVIVHKLYDNPTYMRSHLQISLLATDVTVSMSQLNLHRSCLHGVPQVLLARRLRKPLIRSGTTLIRWCCASVLKRLLAAA